MNTHDQILSTRLNSLQEKYVEYRIRAKHGDRVPAYLRTATLALIADGMDAKLVGRVCRLQSGQLRQWEESHLSKENQSPRVLQVTEESITEAVHVRVTIEGSRIVIESSG